MIIKSSKGFEIEIQEGIVKQKGLPEGFVITDKNLFNNYKSLIGDNGFVINAGEKSKTLQTYLGIMKSIDNADNIIAFGGGVVGDIAGFVASTFKRGIPLIQVPTSLMAMIDSSIGGKNGVNLEERKNYIGTIYQPEKILIDPSFLETLPNKEFKEGVAEIIKYGILFGKPDLQKLLKTRLEISDLDLPEIICQCCQNKVGVIEIDENDKGYRHILNFGHTIGHALELLYNLSHGEAISIGMVKESEIAVKLDLLNKEKLEDLKKVLLINNLPINLPPNLNIEKVLSLMKQDKKGSFVFAFNKENHNVKVDESIVRGVLR